MGERYRGGWAVVLGSLLGLLAVIGVSAPAAAGDVTACGNFSTSTDTRFDLKNNITFAGGGTCLTFPANAVVYLHGFIVSGPGYDATPPARGIFLDNNSFLWGPGIVKQFALCVDGENDVAVETVLLNQCGVGLELGESYKVKEVRIHDCTPSSFTGIAMLLDHGGFIESSIVRACDFGVITGQNNKIWNLVITRHSFTGLIVGAGNAVSRTVISHPRSSATIGLDYRGCGGAGAGCQDGSNSVSGHAAGANILTPPALVVTQPTETVGLGATNCGGSPIPRTATGLIAASC
jgi:hypothetical protein